MIERAALRASNPSSSLPELLQGKSIDYTYERRGDTALVRATFNTLLNAEELAILLTTPLKDAVKEYTTPNLDRGMKAFTLPHTRIYKGLTRFGSHVSAKVYAMADDIRGLSQVLRGATDITVSGYVYDKNTVMSAARDRLLDARLKDLLEICRTVYPGIDEVALARRADGRNAGKKWGRHLRLYDFEDLGMNAEELRHHVIENEFYRKIIRTYGGFEVVYLNRQDASNEKVRAATNAERVRQLPKLKENDYAERWRLRLYDPDKVTHFAVPELTYEQHLPKAGSKVRSSVRIRHDASRHVYDRSTNTMLHFSSIAALAGLIQTDYGERAAEVANMAYDKGSARPIPPNAIGTLPLVLATFDRQLPWTQSFKDLTRPIEKLTRDGNK